MNTTPEQRAAQIVDAAGIEARNAKWLAATQQMSPEERANLITNPEASQAFANYISGVPRTLAEKAKNVMLVYTAAPAWAASQGITDPNFASGTGQPGSATNTGGPPEMRGSSNPAPWYQQLQYTQMAPTAGAPR